nr:hypothetical protein [Sulfolobus islandicus]
MAKEEQEQHISEYNKVAMTAKQEGHEDIEKCYAHSPNKKQKSQKQSNLSPKPYKAIFAFKFFPFLGITLLQ